MRSTLVTLLLLPFIAAPLDGQICKRTPPPVLPDLLPDAVQGMTVRFGTDPTGGCTGMYRPEAEGARQSQPWAMVSIKATAEDALGEDAEAIRRKYPAPVHTVFTMAGWPVVMREAPLGDEFMAFKGSICVTVLVKNGDQGEASRALAAALMERILPEVPCG